MHYILLCFFMLVPGLAGALVFDENTRSLPLGTAMSVFEDVRGDASIEDITSPALQASFRQHDKGVLNAGYSRSVFWLRLDLEYRPQQANGDQPWLLELAYPPLDHVQLYLPDAQGRYQLSQHTGDALPFSSREIKQHNYVFELQLPPAQRQSVYLRLESQGSIQAPLTLWAPNAYLEEQPARIYVLGIIYGVLLVMLIYNLFIFLSVRDTSYLYYILYIASFGFYQLSVNGAAIEYFWPNSPWWANAATPFLIGAAAMFGCQFARSFLHTAEHSPWVDRALLLMMACGVLVMSLALTASYALSLRLATYLALGEPAKARPWLVKAIALQPSSYRAHKNLATCLLQPHPVPRADAREAVGYAEIAISLRPNLWLPRELRIKALMALDRKDEVRQMFEQWLSDQPAHMEGRQAYALHLLNEGGPSAALAVAQFEKLMQQHGQHPYYAWGLGKALGLSGQVEKGKVWLNKAMQQYQMNGESANVLICVNTLDELDKPKSLIGRLFGRR